MVQQDNPMSILLDQLKQKNPEKFQLINQIMQQQQLANSNEASKPKAAPTTKAMGQMKRLISINRQLKEKIQKLAKEKENLLQYLDFFVEINNEFSKAVGACPCFGLDDSCDCKKSGTLHNNRRQNIGGPGTHPVNLELFKTYVAPCLSNELLAAITKRTPVR